MSRQTRLADASARALGASGAPSAATLWLAARLTDAAEGFAALSERLRPRRRLLFTEQPDGGWRGPGGAWRWDGARLTPEARTATSTRGADVEFRLRAERCVFRELELPARAGEFLEGVVRAQLDRVTPWRASEAAFGWGAPEPHDGDRIVVTLAATKREPIAGLLDFEADAVVVSTAREGEASIQILVKRAGASSRRGRWRAVLIAALGVSILSGVAALAAQLTLGASLNDASGTLTASLAKRRVALLSREHAGDDPAAKALDVRKRAAPAAVIVLEALSRAIPDEAYLSQLRLKGDKVEISGIATDAANLVKRIEQSPHFSRATFTAPTTRTAEEREAFRIEAHVAPLFRVSP